MSPGLASLLAVLRVKGRRPLRYHIPGTDTCIHMTKIPPRCWMGAAASEDTPHWQEMLSLGLGPVVETTALVWK